MQPNKLSLTTKITIILMIALENTSFTVSPFTVLHTRGQRKGHPFMIDVVIEHETIGSQPLDDGNTSASSIIVLNKADKKLTAVIEVKKSINADFELVDPSAIIEMIPYVRYMNLHKENTMIGI